LIIWLTGNSESGKSVLAMELSNRLRCSIILDGDEMRKIWTDLDLTIEGRTEQNLRVSRLAKYLESQKYIVVVAVIAPTKLIREQVGRIIDCKWIYLDRPSNKKDLREYPYEVPSRPDLTVYPDSSTVRQETSQVMGVLKIV